MRKKKKSPAEDLVHAVGLLPWWVGILLALITWAGLHHVAGAPAPAPGTLTQPSQIASLVTQSIWRSVASIGQYILPIIFLLGAGLSAWKRHERGALVARVVEGNAADVVNQMTWQQFELLVGEGFRLRGYDVIETGGNGPDGGIDLVLKKGSEKHLVQCKQWRAVRVGVSVVRELYGVMAAEGAAGGFVVTSGSFTDEALKFASGKNLQLVDGPKLLAFLKAAGSQKVGSPAKSRAHEAGADVSGQERTAAREERPNGLAPQCPVCSKAMVRRIRKKAATTNQGFWGCSAFPACRGIKTIEPRIIRSD